MKFTKALFAGLFTALLLVTIGIAAASEEVMTTVTAEPTLQETTGTTDTSGDIAPYDGAISADNPLYGLKLAFEDLDESFTANETERVTKQMQHARLRLSEVRRELALNQTDSAQAALDQYWQKVNITQMSLAYFGANQTGLIHAQEMHQHHQMVLEELMLSHPDNTGLARAYNNSLRLEERFEEKTQMRFEKTMEKNNQTIMRAYRIEVHEQNRFGAGNDTWTPDNNELRNQNRTRLQETGNVTPQHQNDLGPQGNDNGQQNSNNNNNQAGGNGPGNNGQASGAGTSQGNTNDQQDTRGHGYGAPTVTASPQQTQTAQGSGSGPANQGGQSQGNGHGNGNGKK